MVGALQEYHNHARLMVANHCSSFHHHDHHHLLNKKRKPLQDISNISPLKKRKVTNIQDAADDTTMSNPSYGFAPSFFFTTPSVILDYVNTFNFHSNNIIHNNITTDISVITPPCTLPVGTQRATIEDISDLLFKTCYMTSYINDILKIRTVCKRWDSCLRLSSFRRNMFFVDDILRINEPRFRVNVDYMSTVQTTITDKMRSILVDWMVEVAEEFMWNPETFFLSVNYLDRYLQVVNTPKNKLQLVGTACAMLAAKYEEMRVPSFDTMVEIAAQAFTRDDMIKSETSILKTLNFNMTAVTPRSFLMKYMKAVPMLPLPRSRICHFASYVLELAAVEYSFTKIQPSLIAASALCLSLHCLDVCSWTNTLAIYTQHSLEDEDMLLCVKMLNELVERTNSGFHADGTPSHTRAVFDKYHLPGHMQIARVPLRNTITILESPFFSSSVKYHPDFATVVVFRN